MCFPQSKFLIINNRLQRYVFIIILTTINCLYLFLGALNSTFIIVGTNSNEIPNHPDNVILKPKSSLDELVIHYSQAEFYLQLSMSEGFPNSLCEAMLCECVPIVSHVASMPFIVADSGFVLARKNLGLLKKVISKVAQLNNFLSQRR